MITAADLELSGGNERDSRVRTEQPADPNAARWLILFLILSFAVQIGLFFLGSSSLRLALRVGCYLPSLMMLIVRRGRGIPHPAAWCVAAAMVVLGVCFLIPEGSGPVASLAQSILYLAVLAPLIWASKLKITPKLFRTTILIMWSFYTCSALFGMLQVEYPGVYDGALSANYDEKSIAPHLLARADGVQFIRPKGLSDTPGGAAVAGVYTIVLGFGLFLNQRNLIFRGVVAAGFAIGLFCIYLSQGRTNLIIVIVASASAFVILVKRGLLSRAAGLLATIGIAGIVGTTLAFAIGGDSTINRFSTLTADDPSTVYYDNRGQFLEQMVTEDVAKFPLGAGIGRWGMISYYFGSPDRALWAEIMWQALLYDGGLPLVAIYAVLMVLLLRTTWEISGHAKSESVSTWAPTVFGHTVAAVAASFVFPIFSIQLGMDVMLLNGALWAMDRTEQMRIAGIVSAETEENG